MYVCMYVCNQSLKFVSLKIIKKLSFYGNTKLGKYKSKEIIIVVYSIWSRYFKM